MIKMGQQKPGSMSNASQNQMNKQKSVMKSGSPTVGNVGGQQPTMGGGSKMAGLTKGIAAGSNAMAIARNKGQRGAQMGNQGGLDIGPAQLPFGIPQNMGDMNPGMAPGMDAAMGPPPADTGLDLAPTQLPFNPGMMDQTATMDPRIAMMQNKMGPNPAMAGRMAMQRNAMMRGRGMNRPVVNPRQY